MQKGADDNIQQNRIIKLRRATLEFKAMRDDGSQPWKSRQRFKRRKPEAAHKEYTNRKQDIYICSFSKDRNCSC
jgi:hypothetical protein